MNRQTLGYPIVDYSPVVWTEGTWNRVAPAGSVMTIAFELQGQQFVALNGGPGFSFANAVSLVGGRHFVRLR